MRRALLIVAVAVSMTALLAAAASAHRAGAAASGGSKRYKSCPRVFNGTKSFGALAVSQIRARRISCATAYHYIENFPDDHPYRCSHRFAPPSSFKYVCSDGSKAFRFTAQGE